MLFFISYKNIEEKRKIKIKWGGGRWWHKGLYPMTLQFSVWSVVYIHMYKVNRDGVVSDKIMQTIFKISYLFLRSDWHLYKKEVKFRYQEGCAKSQEQVKPHIKLKP